MRAEWDRENGEPLRWFARFDAYRLLGSSRSIEAAFRQVRVTDGLHGERPGAIWYEMARRWRWAERAEAWDAHMRAELMAHEQERRFDAREKRLSIIDRMIHLAESVLLNSGLEHLSEDESRRLLPQMRIILRDMLHAEQMELAFSAAVGAGDQVQPFSADDLLEASRAVLEFESALQGEGGKAQAVSENAAAAVTPRRTGSLLVVVGDDPQLRVDLAALRKVKRATGLTFHRLSDATSAAFDNYMRRERSKGHGVTLLHMAVHSSAAGVVFSDQVVDGNWLSERLMGVEVMLLAGCRGDSVGDWLGVVPHVVTLDDAISHQDAGTLTEHFWMNIARGVKPDLALELALQRCAPAVSEYVVRHW